MKTETVFEDTMTVSAQNDTEDPADAVNAAAVRTAEALLPDEDTLCDLAELFKIFGDSTRCRILYALAAGELNVSDLAAVLSMTQSAISHQLRVLRQSRLVRCRRAGKTMFYSLADEHVGTILKMGMDHIME